MVPQVGTSVVCTSALFPSKHSFYMSCALRRRTLTLSNPGNYRALGQLFGGGDGTVLGSICSNRRARNSTRLVPLLNLTCSTDGPLTEHYRKAGLVQCHRTRFGRPTDSLSLLSRHGHGRPSSRTEIQWLREQEHINVLVDVRCSIWQLKLLSR